MMFTKDVGKTQDGRNDELFIPDSTDQFYNELIEEHLILKENVPLRRPSAVPNPMPAPLGFGSRVMIWKQDPSVRRLGRRLKHIPERLINGPGNARIKTILPGTTPVCHNVHGDFIFNRDTPESDCVHTFATVWNTLEMYERALNGRAIPWVWNTGGDVDIINVYPRAGMTANAYYSRNHKALKFFYFTPNGSSEPIYTCRSLDIVAHETGHAILDGLRPGWLSTRNAPQTGGLHESFADLSAIFLALSDLEQVETFIGMTKGDLHDHNFLAALAEEFGAALGRPMGLRNADNDLRLSEVSNQVHDISQIFTGAIYDILADIFCFDYRRESRSKSPGHILLETNQLVCNLLLEAIMDTSTPTRGATFTDIVNNMLKASRKKGHPAIYRSFIRNRFAFREVIASPTPLTIMTEGLKDYDNANFVDGGEDLTHLEARLEQHPSLKARQDRSKCCGTMQLIEFEHER